MADPLHTRSLERGELKEKFLNGNSILMLAPRRIGKTWLMDHVADDLTTEGWACIRLDVEGTTTEEGFLKALCREVEKQKDVGGRIWSHLAQRWRQLTTDATSGGSLATAVGRVDPREFLETLIESLDAGPGNTLILIDEIALFVLELTRREPGAARALLYQLRSLMQRYRRVRWFLTGSVGLDVVARRIGLSGAMLGYDVYPLEPFSPKEAHSYADEILSTELASRRFEFEAAAFDHLTSELGWLSPYHLRQTIINIRPTGVATRGVPGATPEDVERAFEKLLTPAHRLHFSAWEEHLVKNFEKGDTERLYAILDILCSHADGELEETLIANICGGDTTFSTRQLRDLLTALSNDGYIRKSNGRWSFSSGLLRRYWLEYIKQ